MTNQDSPNTALSEPVAWMYMLGENRHLYFDRRTEYDRKIGEKWTEIPLYARPPQHPTATPDAHAEVMGRVKSEILERVRNMMGTLADLREAVDLDDEGSAILSYCDDLETAVHNIGAVASHLNSTPESRPQRPSAAPVEVVEAVAQFLHDEGGFDEAWDATWPEHQGDTGQREGGFVRIVPSDVQAKFRDVARRLCTMLPINDHTAAIPLIRAQRDAEIVAWLRSGPDCTTNCENLAEAIERGEHLR